MTDDRIRTACGIDLTDAIAERVRRLPPLSDEAKAKLAGLLPPVPATPAVDEDAA